LFSGIKEKMSSGWVVAITFLVVGTVIAGVRFSFGVFFTSIQDEFGIDRATTSSLFSAHMAIGALVAMLGGWALDRYGPRIIIFVMGLITGLSLVLTSQTNAFWQLYITFGLLFSVGTSAIYVIIVTTISKLFDKSRGLALGIGTTGAGLGMVVVAPLATFLITSYGWRLAFLALGLIAWVVILPFSRLLRNPGVLSNQGCNPGDASASPNAQPKKIVVPDITLTQALKTRNLWLFLISFLLFSFAQVFVVTHIVPHVTDLGFSGVQAASVLTLMGVGAILGRITMGIISDSIGKKLTSIICTVLQAGIMVPLLWANELWIFYLFGITFGFAFSGRGPLLGSMVGDVFGQRNMGSILGVVTIGFAFGSAAGPAVGGLIYDMNQSYYPAFILGIVSLLATSVLIGFIKTSISAPQIPGVGQS